MKRCIISLLPPCAAIILLVCVVPESAADDLPFKATVEMQFQGFDKGYWLYEGEATVPHCGGTTQFARVNIDFDNATAMGTVLVLTSQGHFVIGFEQVWNPAKHRWEGVYEIFFGSGKFADAGGSGRIMSKTTAQEGWVVIDYDGTIIY